MAATVIEVRIAQVETVPKAAARMGGKSFVEHNTCCKREGGVVGGNQERYEYLKCFG